MHLIRLCRKVCWFTEAISTTPALLDEYWMPIRYFSPPDKGMLVERTSANAIAFTGDDEEAQMDRHAPFRRLLFLRICSV